MASFDRTFGEVRSILEAKPTQQGWEELCGHLDVCNEDALAQELVPYCMDKLERWPGELRVLPKTWAIDAVFHELSSPKYRLGTSLEFFCGSTRASWALKGAEGGDKIARFLDEHGGIERIALKGHPLGSLGIRQMCLSPELSRVTYLDLRYTQMGDPGAKHLAACPHLGAVKTLRLRRCKIKASGGAAFAKAKSLANLEHLGLGYNSFGKRAWASIVKSNLLAEEMTYLDMGYNNAGLDAIKAILTPERAASLRALNLRACDIDREDFLREVSGLSFDNLEMLNLENSTDWRTKASVVLEYASFPKLQYLYMDQPDFDDDGVGTKEAFIARFREENPEFIDFVDYYAEEGEFPGNYWVRD